jgi:hypothetical protein
MPNATTATILVTCRRNTTNERPLGPPWQTVPVRSFCSGGSPKPPSHLSISPGSIHQEPFKLVRDLNNAPNLDRPMQTPEMHSHFVNLINNTLNMINKTFQPMSLHQPHLSVNLQKAISAKVLYGTGASISCLSEREFCTIPQHLRPPQIIKTTSSCHRASGQAVPVTRIYNFEIKIAKRTLMHLVNIIWNLHEDAILGINFIHTHQLAYCLER